jgi:hypothetical protein
MAAPVVITPAMALRIALYQAQPSALVLSMTDHEVIQTLAEKLLRGGLTLSTTRQGGWPIDAAAGAAAAADAAAAASDAESAESAAVVNLNTLPDAPAVVPLLPTLETVQIEGAEVLPEVDQTLEQIDVAIGTMDQASVSLAPAPTKVPQITTAMTDASGAVTKTLDAM